MRSRSNSGVRLDGYARLVHQTILCHQVREVSPRLTEDVQCASLDGAPGGECVCVSRESSQPPPGGGGVKRPKEKPGSAGKRTRLTALATSPAPPARLAFGGHT